MNSDEYNRLDYDCDLAAKEVLKLLVGTFNYASDYENVAYEYKDKLGFKYGYIKFIIEDNIGKMGNWIAMPRELALDSDIYYAVRANIFKACRDVDEFFNYLDFNFPGNMEQIVKKYLKELDHSNINYLEFSAFFKNIMGEDNTNLFVDILIKKLAKLRISQYFDNYFEMNIDNRKKSCQIPFSVYNLNLNIKKEII